ncbi:MAG: hypothetical protein JXA46_03535 [Dehalococcoidales bacterium]|nr:hypothetical protein [Dehalococcoidales bacterium]
MPNAKKGRFTTDNIPGLSNEWAGTMVNFYVDDTYPLNAKLPFVDLGRDIRAQSAFSIPMKFSLNKKYVMKKNINRYGSHIFFVGGRNDNES